MMRILTEAEARELGLWTKKRKRPLKKLTDAERVAMGLARCTAPSRSTRFEIPAAGISGKHGAFMANFRFKRVMRLDTIQRHFRLFRVLWERGTVGDGEGYSAKLAVGLLPRVIGWNRDARRDWMVTLFGVRVHYSRSYGGRFA